MGFFLGDKFNGRIIFDFRGQRDVLEVKVITNIRTTIIYPCRQLLVGPIFLKTFDDAVGYNFMSHQHHLTFDIQQLY